MDIVEALLNLNGYNKNSERLDEGYNSVLAVCYEKNPTEDQMWETLREKTGIDYPNGSIYFIIEDTSQIAGELREPGNSAKAYRDKGILLRYFTDGDHGYKCLEIPVKDALRITGYKPSHYRNLYMAADFKNKVIEKVEQAMAEEQKGAPRTKTYLGNDNEFVTFTGTATKNEKENGYDIVTKEGDLVSCFSRDRLPVGKEVTFQGYVGGGSCKRKKDGTPVTYIRGISVAEHW